MKRVTVTKDTVAQVFASIRELVGKEVLIGIPDSTTSRDDQEGEPVTNAVLGYIHEFGSPEHNIPARPFLIPGVTKAKDAVLVPLQKAAEVTLAGDAKKADALLNAAGLIGQASARREISSAEFVPLKPATIRNRRRSRGTKSMRAGEQKYLELIDAGMDPAAAQEAVGIQPLINTGQLRNALTYVVRKRS